MNRTVDAFEGPLNELRARADRTFTGQRVEDAVAKVRAIVGLPHIPDSERLAQAALDKLRARPPQRPTATELAALELVIRMMRPAPLSRNGELEPLPSRPGTNTYNSELAAQWDDFRVRVRPYLYSIGRLDRTQGQDPEIGTGFLVGQNTVLTNRHVLGLLSYGAEALEEGQAVVKFHQESGMTDPEPVPVVGVVAVHPTLDLALLRIALPAPLAVPEFDPAPPSTGAAIAAIGYPLKDSRNPLFADAVFGSPYGPGYGVKRGALGEIIGMACESFFHDCSTLGGNSGSPVFSLASGRIIGVHFSGFFMYRNEAIVAAEAARFVREAVR